MAREIAVSSGAFYPEVVTEETPALAARLGFTSLEVMLQAQAEYQPAFFRKLRQNATAAGVRLHAVHVREQEHQLFAPYARRVREGMTRFEQAIAGTAAIGAAFVVWHGPCDERPPLELLLERLAQLGAVCTGHDVRLALENTARCALPGVREVAAVAKRLPDIQHGNAIGFAFDPFQAAEAGANPYLMLRAMHGRLLDIHVSDHIAGDPGRTRLLPGQGELKWPPLLRAIAASGYEGPLVLEANLLGVDAARLSKALQELTAHVAAPAEMCAAPLPEGVLEGIALFNAGEYFDAHELIETEWHAERGEIRRLYQGILQIGIGFLHAQNGNRRGAITKLTQGIDKLTAFLPVCRGIDTARLVRESQAWLEQIEAMSPDELAALSNWSTLPLVHLVQ